MRIAANGEREGELGAPSFTVHGVGAHIRFFRGVVAPESTLEALELK